jgi:uncharacterized coiled-coil protein SlyX
MTDTQLYLTIGMPTIAVLVGILVNVSYFAALTGRVASLETRINSLETRINLLETRFDARMNALEARFDARMSSLEAKFDILVGKVIEVDNRLTRVEERLKH